MFASSPEAANNSLTCTRGLHGEMQYGPNIAEGGWQSQSTTESSAPASET